MVVADHAVGKIRVLVSNKKHYSKNPKNKSNHESTIEIIVILLHRL